MRVSGATHAVSDTGPLISAFQSDSLSIVTALLPAIHVPTRCRDELIRHGWQESVRSAGAAIRTHVLSPSEEEIAWCIARQIAEHPLSRDPKPENHLGEAQAMALACRPEFADDVVLLGELAARAVADTMRLKLTGFAGVLLAAARQAFLDAEDMRQRLESCQHQGTHYSDSFIEQVYLAAKGGP